MKLIRMSAAKHKQYRKPSQHIITRLKSEVAMVRRYAAMLVLLGTCTKLAQECTPIRSYTQLHMDSQRLKNKSPKKTFQFLSLHEALKTAH